MTNIVSKTEQQLDSILSANKPDCVKATEIMEVSRGLAKVANYSLCLTELKNLNKAMLKVHEALTVVDRY